MSGRGQRESSEGSGEGYHRRDVIVAHLGARRKGLRDVVFCQCAAGEECATELGHNRGLRCCGLWRIIAFPRKSVAAS